MSGRKFGSVVLLSVVLSAAFVSAACTRAPTPAAFDLRTTLDGYLSTLSDDWGMISPATLYEQTQVTKPFIVDLREEREIVDAGYIADSINIPFRSLVENLDKLPAKDQLIVVACGSGQRSAFGMEALQLLGYANVKSLAGGIRAWKASGLPVVTGTPTLASAGSVPDEDENLLAALGDFLGNVPQDWALLSPVALKDLLATSRPFQLDVRETEEIANSGAISGSTNIPLRDLIENLDKLPPDKGSPIVVECDAGHRSALAVMTLRLLGYLNVRNLAGGFTAWTKVAQPTR